MLRGLAAPLNIIKVHVLKVLKQHSAHHNGFTEKDSPWVFVVFQKKKFGRAEERVIFQGTPKSPKERDRQAKTEGWQQCSLFFAC